MTTEKTMISLIVPAYNEEVILVQNVKTLIDYMAGMESEYDWEIVIINDGSSDKTKELADQMAATYPQVVAFHHKVNRNLGMALSTGFRKCRGDIVIVLDIDLSYAPHHVKELVEAMNVQDADIVIASPYMKGGKSTKVPFLRLMLSKGANRFMKFIANKDISTFTGMVRAYNAEFLESLNLKSTTYAVNPEIIYKAILLRARIVEIPAHLDWTLQVEAGPGRVSGMKIMKGISLALMSGFILRPYAFFMGLGSVLSLIAFYIIGWIFFNTFDIYPEIPAGVLPDDRFSEAIATVFRSRPHAFFVGGITLIIALQFLSMGFLSLQKKRYFEELFHINTSLSKKIGRLDK